MVIERIEIEKFATLANVSYDFSDKINVLEGANGSGKSAAAEFIRFMFFGLSAAPTPEGSRRERFLQPYGIAAGTLTLSCEKGRFRIERRIDQTRGKVTEESVAVVDLQQNAPIKGKDPASLFLGVSEEIFDRSFFMEQAEARPVHAAHVGRAVENMLSTSSESKSAEKSADSLDEKIASLSGSAQTEGSILWHRERAADLKKRTEKAVQTEEEYAKTEESVKENEKKAESNKSEYEACRRRLAHADAQTQLERIVAAGRAAKDLEETRAALKNAKSTYGYGDFLPDRAYARSLEQVLGEMLNSTHTAEEALQRRKKSEEDLSLLPEPAGGSHGKLLNELHTISGKSERSKWIFLACAAGAGLLLILFVLFLVLKKILPAVIFLLLALAAGGLAVWRYLRWQQASRKEEAVYAAAGAGNEEELAEAVASNAKLIAERDALEKSIRDETKRAERAKAAYDAALERGETLASRWGRSVESLVGMKDICVKVEEAVEALEKKALEEKQARVAFSALQTDAGQEEARELVELLRSDGIDEKLTAAEYKDLKVKANFYKQSSDALEKRVQAQKQRLQSLGSSMEDRYALEDEARAQEEAAARAEEELRVLCAARDALRESVQYMREQILPEMMESASAFFAEATLGAFPKLEASSSFEVTACKKDGAAVSPGALSGAERELLYLALRICLGEKLAKGRKMPLILDECFSYADDLHLAAAFKALYERSEAQKNQILLLSCRKRETALFERIAPVKKIEF